VFQQDFSAKVLQIQEGLFGRAGLSPPRNVVSSHGVAKWGRKEVLQTCLSFIIKGRGLLSPAWEPVSNVASLVILLTIAPDPVGGSKVKRSHRNENGRNPSAGAAGKRDTLNLNVLLGVGVRVVQELQAQAATTGSIIGEC